ncbi:MAG: DegT/DnrJ/EryC1/StrS family aminotransferase [Tepidisphaerales bacterium]
MKLGWPREFPGVHHYGIEEEKAVLEVVRNRTPFRYYGIKRPKFVLALERQARKFYGVRHALAVNSGTGALMTAMAALGIGPGDEVIVPAFMWVSTVGAVVSANAVPVLCEVDESFTMDCSDLEKTITPRTRLIVPVHMAGAPCDMKSIMAIARRRNIAVLEDCAQCNGGSFAGQKVGTFGTVGMFSLQVNKNCTSGEGGLLVTNDEQLYLRLNAAHDVGVPWADGSPNIGAAQVNWGSGRRMSDLSGALAWQQLRKLPSIVRRMAGSKRRIKAMLAGTGGLSFRHIHDEAGDTACFLIVLLKDGQCARVAGAHMSQAGLPNFRLADYGMHVYYNIPQLVGKVPLSKAGNPWALAANSQSVYSYARGACPRSDELFDRAILVPVPSVLTRRQETAAAGIIRAAVGC